jgi:Sulfotransferase family
MKIGVGAASVAAPTPTPTPIFIVGMHRSGTTLLERLLGNHSRVSEGGELYDFPAQLRRAIGAHFGGPSDISIVAKMPEIDFADVGRRYLAQVAWRAQGRPFLIDKLPSNFINLGFIRRALPQAKVIHMRRNAMDTCFSNLKELFSNACPYSYDQGELAGYYGLHHDLVAHWQQVLPDFVLDVSYEQLARAPDTEARRMLAFCGLGWEPGCIDVAGNQRAVNTASSAQVREPIHRRGIDAWRRYEPWLGSLHTQLAAQGLL